uniref:synaptonemal complex central element protein 1-like n=1 Tax=Pristiophorus japonicus TaxID=55135 RepID=UPI00398E4D2A
MAGVGNAESTLNLATKVQQGKNMEPRIEDIVKKIKSLIEEKRVNDSEVQNLQAQRGIMEKELDELNHEIFRLEGNCNKKEANLKRLHFQYEQHQAQTERQLKVSRDSKQRIEALTSQVEDEKLKRRKERKAFEQQLEELIMKHKWMAEFYTPVRLELEIRTIENTKQQLLTEEHVVKEKLCTLDKELNSLQQRGAASEEVIFLQSKEAKLTHQMFEEENNDAVAQLREAAQHLSGPQQTPQPGRCRNEREPRRKPTAPGRDGEMDAGGAEERQADSSLRAAQ